MEKNRLRNWLQKQSNYRKYPKNIVEQLKIVFLEEWQLKLLLLVIAIYIEESWFNFLIYIHI